MRRKISAIVTTYNEEDNIENCLKSLQWADEIIVVDSFSTDNTVSIAKEYADKVIQHEYKYPARQKNWVIPKVYYEWIILLDADERVTTPLRYEILNLLEEGPDKKAYWIYRRNFFMGREIKHCGWEKDKVIRFFNKSCRYKDVKVHEELVVSEKETGILSGKLVHYPYKNLQDYFVKLKRYSLWGAEKSLQKGKRANLLHVMFAPLYMFLKRYILNLGFLDGAHGLVLSLLAAQSVLFKYEKMWELQITENRKQKTERSDL